MPAIAFRSRVKPSNDRNRLRTALRIPPPRSDGPCRCRSPRSPGSPPSDRSVLLLFRGMQRPSRNRVVAGGGTTRQSLNLSNEGRGEAAPSVDRSRSWFGPSSRTGCLRTPVHRRPSTAPATGHFTASPPPGCKPPLLFATKARPRRAGVPRSREAEDSLGKQGAVLWSIIGFPGEYNPVFFGITTRLTAAYSPTYRNPDRTMAGGRPEQGGEVDARHSGLCGRPGIMGTRGLAAVGRRPGLPPATNLNKLAPMISAAQGLRAFVFTSSGEETRPTPETRQDSERRLNFGFAAHLQEQLPGPLCGLPGVKGSGEGTNKAMPGAATPGTTTLIRPFTVVQWRRCAGQFQKSAVIRVVRPCPRPACPARSCRSRGAGYLRGRHGASPKRSDRLIGGSDGGHGYVGVQASGTG